MNLKLITEHKDYLLLVDTDDSGDYGKWTIDLANPKSKPFILSSLPDLDYVKIIAHLQLNNAPVLEGVLLLPESPKQEKDVDKLAESATFHAKDIDNYYEQKGFSKGFKVGYKEASKKWTDEDMEECWASAIDFAKDSIRMSKIHNFQDYLKTLSPTLTPIGFVLSDKFISLEENIRHGKYVFK